MEIPNGPSIFTKTESGFLILTSIHPWPDCSGESNAIFPDASIVSITTELLFTFSFISFTGILSASFPPEPEHAAIKKETNKYNIDEIEGLIFVHFLSKSV